MLPRQTRKALHFNKLFTDQGPIISATLFESAAPRLFSLRRPIDPLVTPLRPKNCGWQGNLMLLWRSIRLRPLFDRERNITIWFGELVLLLLFAVFDYYYVYLIEKLLICVNIIVYQK